MEEFQEKEIWESHLAGRLGMAREDVRQIRRQVLKEGEGWRTEGNRIVLTLEGARQILQELGVSPSLVDLHEKNQAKEAEQGLEKGGGAILTGDSPKNAPGGDLARDSEAVKKAPSKKIPLRVLHVTKLVYNPRIVLATDLTGQVFRLRVRDKAKYRPGMVVPARPVAGDLYEVVGRGPRWPGKW